MSLAAEAHVAILTQQVSNYHAARYHAAQTFFGRVTVLSALNAADFPEFLADQHHVAIRDPIIEICRGRAEYEDAIATGRLWRHVTDALDRVRPDVVAVAGWSFSESLAAVAWARANGRSVVLMSESQEGDAARSRWRETMKSRVVKACDAALVASDRHRRYVEALGLPLERVFLGYDAVDNAHFAAGADKARSEAVVARAAEGLPESYILASARFIAKKNLPRLIEAFAEALKRSDCGHCLVILGDGPERSTVEATVKRLGVGARVKLPGFRSYDLLPAYYGLSEGFVHVSLAEQWGLVVNEAAASGLPLVVSRPCGAATTLVHPGRNGFIVDPLDVSDVACAIAGVMALSPKARTAMGAESRVIVADWGPERFASGLAGAAEAAMAQPCRRLSLIDLALFRALARVRISRVS